MMDHISGWFPVLGAILVIFLIWKGTLYVLKNRPVVEGAPAPTVTTSTSAQATSSTPAPRTTAGGTRKFGGMGWLVAIGVVVVLVIILEIWPIHFRETNPSAVSQNVASNGVRPANLGWREPTEADRLPVATLVDLPAAGSGDRVSVDRIPGYRNCSSAPVTRIVEGNSELLQSTGAAQGNVQVTRYNEEARCPHRD